MFCDPETAMGKVYMGYTFMSRNKQSRKYLIGCSYKDDEFDWPFDLVIVT